MEVGKLCTVDIICCARDESVQGAAFLMRKHHVGDIVVVDDTDSQRTPAGIVTDRDIVVSVVALGLDPNGLQVGDIMTDDLLTADEHDDVNVIIERMRLRGIRRVPVVGEGGRLVGIVSADDLLGFLAEEMEDLARISPYQQQHERRTRQ
ncbi:CBS domain-containing protein [Massilia sp. TW-1]|uniref:CBS domain-containing protein n=1 Tax=Telluria antibiotica TaxID=2717319 RepID=A0ABX0PBU4_9BURK|nr:CBS domain-containing protein [Telluria antibiotica]NIA54801.1 CBS domain-containing protein [Telluria antibiotica]